MDARNRNAYNLLINSGCAQKGEKVFIITDSLTKEIGDFLQSFSNNYELNVKHHTIEALSMHGAEPPTDIHQEFLSSDLVLGLTSFSMAHTQIRKSATEKGVRYLSLPDYDWSVFDSQALSVDLLEQRGIAKKVKAALDDGDIVNICTSKGTNVSFSIRGRLANNCDAVLDTPGSLGSPPDIEVNIAPLEHLTEGKIVFDGSIPHPDLGILDAAIEVILEKGKIVSIESDDKRKVSQLKSLFDNAGPKSMIVGELGFGLNPLAELSGRMLEDEGIKGSFHCGFGSNSTIGGKNKVNFHLDFICMYPDVKIDDETFMVNGNILDDC